jgi:hypothetical protein
MGWRNGWREMASQLRFMYHGAAVTIGLMIWREGADRDERLLIF